MGYINLDAYFPAVFAGTAPAQTGAFNIGNNQAFSGRNNTNLADLQMMILTSANNIEFSTASQACGVYIRGNASAQFAIIFNSKNIVFADATGVTLGPDATSRWIVLNGTNTTTAPSAGASATVTPAGYLDVTVNGTTRKLAYYNNA